MGSWSIPSRGPTERRAAAAVTAAAVTAAALCLAACAAHAAPAERAGDAAAIAADPAAHAGETVTVAVTFRRIESGRDPWEEQGDLKASRVIKFTVSPFGGLKCYADRTDRTMEALTGLRKGSGLLLTGAVRRCRTAVQAEYDVKRPAGRRGGEGGEKRERRHRRWWGLGRTEYAPERYVFMVESVERTERGEGGR